MRRTLLLTCVGLLGAAGLAYAAADVTNEYVISAGVKPLKSGSTAHPRTVSRLLQWDVSTAPPGRRPANVRGYQIASVGLQQHTTQFPGCGTSRLTTRGPAGCRKGSLIGIGYAIIEYGPTGQNNSAYNTTCRAEEDLFNGGNNNESLYIYEGSQRRGQPGPCPILGRHAVININLSQDNARMIETFSEPLSLLHPSPGFDASIIHEALAIPSYSETITIRHGGQVVSRHHVGLFESFFCPPNHQRQVAITFTREDGVSRTRTALVACKP